MPQLLCTLLGEGPSDDALVPIVERVLENPALGLLPSVDIILQFMSIDQSVGGGGLVQQILATASDVPCDMLFVHHDADDSNGAVWRERVDGAVAEARRLGHELPPAVAVVPVREMEAWLLFDERAIRQAVRNARGTAKLDLPRLHDIEACQDPKAVLRDALRAASGLPRRRWSQVDRVRPRAVADLIADISPLRQLPAFQAFEADVQRVIAEQGWPERLG